MKHTIKGKHGHVYQLDTKEKRVEGRLPGKTICVSASEAARNDFSNEEIDLRFKLSLKWGVCAWCWTPTKNVEGVDIRTKKPISYGCGFGRCPAWGKPVRETKIKSRGIFHE